MHHLFHRFSKPLRKDCKNKVGHVLRAGLAASVQLRGDYTMVGLILCALAELLVALLSKMMSDAF